MIYFNTEQYASMKANSDNLKLDAILQRIFPDNNKWGACPYFENGKLDFIEINKLSDVTQKGETWTHYATIGRYKSKDENNGEFWEVYSQFNGKLEDEMWIYGYYKYFKGACHCAASESFLNKTRKPIKIYI